MMMHSITYFGNSLADTNFIDRKKKINNLMYIDDIKLPKTRKKLKPKYR